MDSPSEKKYFFFAFLCWLNNKRNGYFTGEKNKQTKKTRHDTAETSLLNLHFLKTIITRLCAQWNLFGYHKQCQQLERQYMKTELAA